MTPVSTPPVGSDGPAEPPQIRIGNDERDAAMGALDAHLTAGRLDPDEYGDRVAKVSVARTRDQLEALFVDPPAPHPFDEVARSAGRTAVAQPRAGQPPEAPGEPHRQPLGGRAGAVLTALSPFIALALFLLTKWWIWFLLIPAIGAIVYGGRRDRRNDH
jgi:uncharacterized protein DUF1707